MAANAERTFWTSLIASILSLRNKIGSKTTVDMVEKRLLSTAAFCDVTHIKHEGLTTLLTMLQSGSTGFEYSPSFTKSDSTELPSEIQALKDQRLKKEIALRRLKSLFLYGADDIPEKEFILERKQLVDDINAIDKKLSGMTVDDGQQNILNDTFIEKASYFIMVDQLTSVDTDDPSSFMRSIDTRVIKSFLQTIVDRITILSGKVASVKFKSGITLEFEYN